MKKDNINKYALQGLLIVMALSWTTPGRAISVVASKHNLAFGSGNAVTGTNALNNRTCIFCHAPHRVAKNVPLWNRADSAPAPGYTFYSSNYRTVKGRVTRPTGDIIPDAEQVGLRTKMCLSCHDGLIAVGALANTGSTVPLSGVQAGGEIPLGASNLSTNLSDDHPVMYPQPVADPEFAAVAAVDARLKFYGSSNVVECTTCHDPHNNVNGDFLVMPNTNAAMCKQCHIKSGYNNTSIHDTTTVAYTPPGYAATNVGEWSCRSCHTMHNANPTQAYQLKAAEENTCLACHTGVGVAADDLQTVLGRVSKHPVIPTSGVHINPETTGTNLGNATRHAECQDCHNPHKMQAGTSVLKGTNMSNLITRVLIGIRGVLPTYSGTAWTLPTFANKELLNTATDKEYELCFRCHSSYAFGATPPPGGTDVAREFNPANASTHPVVQAGSNVNCDLQTMVSPWNQTAGEHDTMTCSDCHHSSSPTDPLGPHGSDATNILRASMVAVQTVNNKSAGTPLCLQCHKTSTYATDGSGAPGSNFKDHDLFEHQRPPNRTWGCQNCHGNNQPGNFHGMNYLWPATAQTNSSLSYKFIGNTTNLQGWNPGACWTAANGCGVSEGAHFEVY